MGTNYYINGIHIGKRSAAGPFCWDCRVSLSKDRRGPHYGEEMFEKCPKCGKENSKDNSAAMRELFGDANGETKREGVTSCSSFSWAVHPYEIPEGKLMSEYDEEANLDEILKDCPLQYFDSIGKEFC